MAKADVTFPHKNRHCTCYVTVTRIRFTLTVVQIKKQYTVWMCVRSHIYPACEVHVPYYRLRPVWLYNIFPNFLSQTARFRENVIVYKMCYDILYTSV